MRNLVLMLMSILLLTACERRGQVEIPPLVVCTTAFVADCAREIGGSAFRVEQLMGQGVDPHLYKPTPRDVALISDADLVLYSGLHLEGRLVRSLNLLPPGRAVGIADAIPHERLIASTDYPDAHDPHVWFDASLWAIAAERAAESLVTLQPSLETEIRGRLADYRKRILAAHEYAKSAIDSIPEQRRVLVTAHDAFRYFSRAYGIEVQSIQGLSTESEASLARVNELTTMLVDRKIPAVFVESSVPRKTVQALIEGARTRGASIRLGGELFSDAAGAKGTPEATYIGMFMHNVNAIRDALARESEVGP